MIFVHRAKAARRFCLAQSDSSIVNMASGEIWPMPFQHGERRESESAKPSTAINGAEMLSLYVPTGRRACIVPVRAERPIRRPAAMAGRANAAPS